MVPCHKEDNSKDEGVIVAEVATMDVVDLTTVAVLDTNSGPTELPVASQPTMLLVQVQPTLVHKVHVL